MSGSREIIDVWMRHPTMRFVNHPMFDSLRRWLGQGTLETEIPLGAAIETMDRAGVGVGLLSAWWGAHGPIISNDEAAIEFPELRMVCGHIGYPWTDEMIAVATKHPNVFIDTSAYVSGRYPPELVAYMKKNGKQKVLFGTNYPMLTAEKCLRDLDSLGLDEDGRRLFLSGNARRVFSIG